MNMFKVFLWTLAFYLSITAIFWLRGVA